MRALWVVTLAGLLGIGCQCGGRAALSITVAFENSTARCVLAGVQLEGTPASFSSPRAIARANKDTLVFGVARTESIKGRVVPFARGYRAADCAAIDLEVFDEETIGDVVDLTAEGVQPITLTLRGQAPVDGGFDAGQDAGVDAGFDAGCALLDCADSACDTKPCAAGGRCGLTSDGGRACIQPVETLCDDLMDNDGDRAADCADADCAAQACNDGDRCTTTDRCDRGPDGGSFCDAGSGVVSCPPNAMANCRSAVGQCLPATGLCAYAVLDAGTTCDDGLQCTYAERCGLVGDCVGTAYTCTSTVCATNAQCDGLGGCSFVFSPGTTPCDDATSCTHTDRCGDAGVCTGLGYACNPPACFSGTGCDGDGGCLFTFNGVDSGCPGGTCGPDAGCVLAGAFGYVPSNFDPASIPDASIAPATSFSGCTVEFDTTTNTFPDGGWCNQVRPTPFVFTQDGGVSTTVLAMAGFDLAANSTLIVYGSRPLILAVYGAAGIHGVIDARSLDLGRVGPGGNWAGCGLMNGGHAQQSAGGGGAGFGTAGARGGGAGFGDGGLAGANPALRPLIGGCLGGRGHDSSNRLEAPGGPGGGAVQISSSSVLTVDGTISTSGGGGLGGTSGTVDHNGGGGGGSGGAILLEGQQLNVTSTARLVCNGGGGGGGREDGLAVGAAGQRGALDTVTPALGGQRGTPAAGDGGNGAAGLTPPTPGVAGIGIIGSGGGGAGLGVIRLNGIAGCSIADAGVLSGSTSRQCP